jgi:hypothetical protein
VATPAGGCRSAHRRRVSERVQEVLRVAVRAARGRLLDVEPWEYSTPPAPGAVEQSSPAPPRMCRRSPTTPHEDHCVREPNPARRDPDPALCRNPHADDPEPAGCYTVEPLPPPEPSAHGPEEGGRRRGWSPASVGAAARGFLTFVCVGSKKHPRRGSRGGDRAGGKRSAREDPVALVDRRRSDPQRAGQASPSVPRRISDRHVPRRRPCELRPLRPAHQNGRWTIGTDPAGDRDCPRRMPRPRRLPRPGRSRRSRGRQAHRTWGN